MTETANPQPAKPTAKPAKRHWAWRLTKVFLRIGAALFVVCLLLIMSAFMLLATEGGRLWVLGQVQQLLPANIVSVVIEEPEWPALGEIKLGYLHVSQQRNPLVEATQLHAHVDIPALFKKQFHIYELSADKLKVTPPPAREKPKTQPKPLSLALPQLPTARIDKLQVNQFDLRPLVKAPATGGAALPPPSNVSITGFASLMGEQPLLLSLTITEEGHSEPLVWLKATSQDDGLGRAVIEGGVWQPTGEWLSTWLKLPAEQPIDIRLNAHLERSPDALKVSLDELALPVKIPRHKGTKPLVVRGDLTWGVSDYTIHLNNLELEFEKRRHRVSGLITLDAMQLETDIQKLNLAIASPWVPKLTGGYLSAEGELAWRWSQEPIPRGSFALDSQIIWQGQKLGAESKLSLDGKQLRIKRTNVTLGDMRLSAAGRVNVFDRTLAVTTTATHFRDEPIRKLLPPAIAAKIPQNVSVHVQKAGGLIRGAFNDPQFIGELNSLGQYAGLPFILHGGIAASAKNAEFYALNAEWGTARAKANGLLDWSGNNTALDGELRHVAPDLLEALGIAKPQGLVGFLNADWQVKGPLKQPFVAVDGLFQGGYEHLNSVLPFKLNVVADAQVGALDKLSVNIETLQVATFTRPLLNISGRVNSQDNDLKIIIKRLPTDLLEALGYPIGSGRAEARLQLAGSFVAPSLNGYISYGETIGLRDANDERREVPLIWHANLSSEEGDLLVDSSFTLDRESAGDLQIQLPWHSYLNFAMTQSGGDVPTTGSIQTQIDTSALQLFLDADQTTILGQLETDLTLEGTASAPILTGEILFKNGLVRHAATGTLLNDIQVYALAEKERINLVTAFARDGEGGSLRGSGHIDWRKPDSPNTVDLTLTAEQANLINTDNAKGAISGEAKVNGGMKGLDVKGKFLVQPLNINIDSTPAASIPELKVTEVYEEDDEKKARGSNMPPVNLDITVNIDKQAFIRGRGLTAELAGKVKVSGTAKRPKVAGNFKTLRGEIKLLQKPLLLSEGQAQFSNDAFSYSIPATYDTGDTEITIVVSGNEDELKLDLSSVPSLPKEEILARLLFGDSVQNISAWEAISLASAVNTLSNGSSFDPVGSTRDKLGFDSLSIDQNSEENGGGVNVGVGKYLNERVYLELERSSNPAQPWQGNLKIDLTDELRLNSTTGNEGKTSANIEWRHDY